MSLDTVLDDACFSADLKSQAKDELINELIDLLHDAGKITDKQAVLGSVMEREEKMSTGMQAGIALPHGKTSAIKEVTTVIALKKEGVDFSSLDGEPSKIFVMILSPTDSADAHIEALSAISSVLGEESIRGRLLAASTPEEMKAALLSAAL